MKQTTAQQSAPSPKRDVQTPKSEVGNARSQTTLFVTMALDMSWRLALIVLIPLLGGVALDNKFNSSPAFTIVGFLLAMAGTAYVLWWASQKANSLTAPKGGAK